MTMVTLRWSDIAAEASELVRLAEEQGLTIRLLGSAGIRLHCEESADRMDELDRSTKDVDLVIRKEHRSGVRALLDERGYEMDRDVLVAMEGQRFLFRNPETGLELDVFVDRLEFCHTMDVRDRLDAHPLSLPVEDLLLSKTQIVELTPNDLKDIVTLLSTHEVAEDDADHPEALSAPYIGRLLSSDWGFHHTVLRNLDKVRTAVADGAVAVGIGDRSGVIDRIRGIVDVVERTEKSLRWRMRAKVGERLQWFNDVDEREATY